MNKIRNFLSFALVAVTVAFAVKAFALYGPVTAIIATALVWLIASTLFEAPRGILLLTLSGTEVVQRVLGAFKTVLPAITRMSTDFSAERAKYNQQIMARIASIPAVQDYDTAGGGYKTNAANATTLLTDVPITMNKWRHVPIQVKIADVAKSVFNLTEQAIINCGYALAKDVMDTVLGQVLSANFSYSQVTANADFNLSTLNAANAQLSKNKASPFSRFGVINSDVAQQLREDPRLSSSLFYSQLNGETPLLEYRNVAGFRSIYEYPDLPANAQSLTAFLFDPRAIAVATRVPQDPTEVAAAFGLPLFAKFDTVTDPDTGLTLLSIMWIDPTGSFDVYFTIAIMYGVVAGSQGGGANALADKAGYRITSA